MLLQKLKLALLIIHYNLMIKMDNILYEVKYSNPITNATTGKLTFISKVKKSVGYF